jgi:hypothetical protein
MKLRQLAEVALQVSRRQTTITPREVHRLRHSTVDTAFESLIDHIVDTQLCVLLLMYLGATAKRSAEDKRILRFVTWFQKSYPSGYVIISRKLIQGLSVTFDEPSRTIQTYVIDAVNHTTSTLELDGIIDVAAMVTPRESLVVLIKRLA